MINLSIIGIFVYVLNCTYPIPFSLLVDNSLLLPRKNTFQLENEYIRTLVIKLKGVWFCLISGEQSTPPLAEAGVGLHEIMEKLGHKDDDITRNIYMCTRLLITQDKFSPFIQPLSRLTHL